MAKPDEGNVRVRRRKHRDWDAGHHEVGEDRAGRARVEAGVIMCDSTHCLDLIRGDNSTQLCEQQTAVEDVGSGRGLQRAGYRLGAVGCRINDAGRQRLTRLPRSGLVLSYEASLHSF